MRKSMCVERTAGRAGKRLISSALAILMCLSLVPATPKAAGPTAKQLPVTQSVLTTEVNRKSRSEEPSATEVKVPEAQAKSAGKAVEAVAPSTAPDRIGKTADQDSAEQILPEHTGGAHPSGKESSVSSVTEPPTSGRAENKVAGSTLKQTRSRSGSALPLEPAALAEVPADGAYTVPVALRNHKYQGALSSNASVEVEGGQVKSAKLQFHGFSLGDKYTHLKGFVWPGAELADPEVEADLSAPFYVEQEYPPQEGDFQGGTEAFTQTVELRNLALSAQGLAQAVSYKDPVTGEQVADFVDFDFASSYCRPTESIEKADWIMLQCNIAGYLGAVSKYLGRDADKRFEADSLRVFRSTLGDLEANIREESLSYEELYEFLSSAYEASCHLKILVDPAGLADGKYKLPVKLMHAYNDGQASMGNGAVVQTAVAEVKDGKADLYIQMQGLHFLGMYGHLWNMFQWQDDGTGQDPYAFKGKTVAVETIRTGADSSLMDDMMDFPEVLKLKNCDVQKAYVPVMVWVDAMDAIQSEDSSSYKTIQKGKGAQNAKLTPDWSKAEKIAEGRDLQSVLGIAGAQTYIASAKTDLSAYSQKTAVAYKNSLEALKAIVAEDSADANKIYETIQDFKVKRHGLVEARKEELKDLLDRAGQLVKSDYTEDSWNKLSEAMKDGKQIYYAARSSDADIAQAVAGLKEALAGLQKLVDKSKLEAKLTEAKALAEADYTEASWQVLQQAVAKAEGVKQDAAATADEVAQAVAALEQAITALKEKSTLIQPTLVSVDHAPTKWTLNVPGQNFVLKVNSDLANLVSVKVNGQILAAAAYTAASGSTVITLQPVYLNSLAPGPYTLTMTYKEGGDFAAGEVEHAFTVLPEPVDKSALVAKINEAKALVEADYTEASWQALQTALVKAEAVNQAADVTADQVAAEVSGLDRAIKSLVQKTAPAPGTTTTTTGTSQPTTTTTATTAGTGQPTTTTTATTAGTSQPTATTKPGGPTSQGPSATKPGPKAPEANKPGKPGLARTGQAMTSVYLVCGLTVLAVGAFALKKRRQD